LSGPNNSTIAGDETVSTQQITTANGSCKDNAGNTGTNSFGPIYIDTTGPVIVVTSPMANQQFILNSQIMPGFSCGEGITGIDTVTCTATPSGLPYTASPVGAGAFSISAMDQAGYSASSGSIPYLVVYNFTGFQTPLQSAVMSNPPNTLQPNDSGSFTTGTAIPIAWQLQDATNAYVSDPTTLTSIVAIPNPTCAGTVSGAGTTLYDGTSVGLAAFSYDNANNRFVFNWDTTPTVPGCYNLVVTTNDTAQWSTIVHVVTPPDRERDGGGDR
jgi:hypothetical protein